MRLRRELSRTTAALKDFRPLRSKTDVLLLIHNFLDYYWLVKVFIDSESYEI
jgi:hypothetical protein